MGAFQLKVTLRGIRPPIWRRFLVPDQITMDRLHLVLQTVMGWNDAHLHLFEVAGRRIGDPDVSYGMPVEDARRITLASLAGQQRTRFTYWYDFGDDWQHDIVVEKTDCPGADERRVVCLAGRRACPPEDCGGVWGYQDLLADMAETKAPDTTERLHWLEEVHGPYDPAAFFPAEVTARLATFDPLPRGERLQPRRWPIP